jgi:hypothetical protein
MSWDSDDYMGGNTEIGESLRGMQHTNMGAAPRRKLSGALGQLAAARFNQHAPVQKELRSPFKDSTQMGVLVSGTVYPENYTSDTSPIPIISGKSRAYQSFKPEKLIMTEILIATYTNASDETVKVAASVSDASDLVLVQAFCGNYNCFPNAPDESNGISGAAFAYNALGNGISWPTINPGIDVSASIGVEETVLYRATPPDGYTSDDLVSVKVKCRLNIFGPQLR